MNIQRPLPKEPFLQRFMCKFCLRPFIARLPGFIFPRKFAAVMNGFNTYLDLREGIQRTIYFKKYEEEQTNWFKLCIKPGDVVVDVGANFGYYTSLAALLVGGTGKVFAFEPSPQAFSSIEKMITNSDVDNITLIKSALGRKKEFVDLHIPSACNLHSPSILASDPSFKKIKINVDTLDDFADINKIETINLVKIDVEGYELDVIFGMKRLLSGRRIKNIICEFNSGWLMRNETSPDRLLQTILDAGFVVTKETKLLEGLEQLGGGTFTLQDRWFTLSDS